MKIELLTMQQAEEFLGLGRRNIKQFIKDGLLEYIDVSHSGKLQPRYRFEKKDLISLIDKLKKNR